jgi:hypothetical protein
MYKILLLLAMIFLHIVDDYYLQGWLASAKQKSWWQQNAPDELYKYDYIMALFMHGFSWAFMIMIVPTVYALITTTNIGNASLAIALVFLANLCIHMTVDNAKANLKKINLVQDQLLHLVQIAATWLSFVVAA